jgi:hypothetical protein
VDHTTQHIPPELIRPERVVPARTLKGVSLVADDRALGREHVREQRYRQEQGDDRRAD